MGIDIAQRAPQPIQLVGIVALLRGRDLVLKYLTPDGAAILTCLLYTSRCV